MRRTIGFAIIAIGFVAGIAIGEIGLRSIAFRDWIGWVFGRGKLVALVHGKGIYEIDLLREAETASPDRRTENHRLDPKEERELLGRLVVKENVRRLSLHEPLSERDINRELDLLYFEFADKKQWAQAIHRSGISVSFLQDELRRDGRSRRWIEQRIPSEIKPDDESCHQYYVEHSQEFEQPLRLRARHIFLAAPATAPPEIVEAKSEMIESIATRLAQGEDFSQLAAEASEDEATKQHGGDLGFFSRWRMPPDFFEPVSKYEVGEIGKAFRSHLGFHIVRLTAVKPPRQLTFDEVRSEIACRLSNQQRQIALANLSRQLINDGEYFWR